MSKAKPDFHQVAVLVLITFLTGSAEAISPIFATISVQANRVIAPVNPLLFGQNFGPWMNTTSEYVENYRLVGVTLLRAPGGNYGDENDLYPNNLDDLAKLADELKAEVVVQTRLWRQGTVEKAENLVRYSNLDHDFHFRFWEIGNKPDLYNNRINRPGDPVFDVDWYNTQFREFSTAIKALDPQIQIVGPAVTGGWRSWMSEFIQANGDIVDVLSWHWYAHGDEMTDQAVLATPREIEYQIETIRSWWVDPQINPLGYQRPVPPLFISEYNVSWATSVRRHLGSQVGALWNAEVLGRMANLGVEMAAHFALQGTTWQGLIGMLEDRRPIFGVYQLFSRWGNEQIHVESTNENLLPVFASRRKDGRLTILVINKDPSRPLTALIKLTGFRPSNQARIWLQEKDQPVIEIQPIKFAREMTYTFQPYSITLFEIESADGQYRVWLLVIGAIILTMLVVFLLLKARAKKAG